MRKLLSLLIYIIYILNRKWKYRGFKVYYTIKEFNEDVLPTMFKTNRYCKMCGEKVYYNLLSKKNPFYCEDCNKNKYIHETWKVN